MTTISGQTFWSHYRAVYLTEPDIPRETQEGLAAWIKNGGTLVTVSNAGSMDRYDEPCDVLQTLETAAGNRRQGLLIDNLNALNSVGKVSSSDRKQLRETHGTYPKMRAARRMHGLMMAGRQ